MLPTDERLRIVHLRDLAFEIDKEVVSSFLADFGEVLSVSHCFFNDFPTVHNGYRVAQVLLDSDIPHFVEVEGCSCLVWYLRQPAQCSICLFGNRVAQVLLELKYFLSAISHTLLKSMDAADMFGIYASELIVLFASCSNSLVIVPQPARSLVSVGAVISLAMWPESVHRPGAHPFLCLMLLLQ